MPRTRDTETREVIIAAATAIVAEDGYDALNMRALAERSGVATMTLYRYVDGKERLLSMLAEQAFAELALPEAEHEDWEEEVLVILRAAHALLLRRPELVEIVGKQHMNGRPSFAAGERAMRAMVRGGMTSETAAHAFVAVVAYLVGITQRQLYGADNIAHAWAAVGELPREEFEHIVANAPALVPGPPDAVLEDGLRMLLRGFATR